jgi:hypothetical protein
MPSKGHKAASRQAKLREKKRRGKGAAQVFQTGPAEPSAAAESTSDAVSEAEPGPASPPAAVSLSRSRAPRRSAKARQAEPAPPYVYLGGEIRRIGAIAAFIFVALGVLTFVLGN